MEPTLDELLAEFCSQDAARASRAFEALAVITRRGLHGYLHNKLRSDEAREDVIQDVLRRIWARREQFENRGAPAWWKLVKLAADQCRIDLVRKIGQEIAWDESEMGSVPNEDLAVMENLIEAISDAENLARVADELWLGFDPELSDVDRSQRILAAHLFYTQGFSWEDVCMILNRGVKQNPVTRAQLDSWLAAPSTIRALAFRSLYVDNPNLACHILSVPPEELATVVRVANSDNETIQPPGDWTWSEVRAIVWRFHDAERQDKILARDRCSLDKTEILELFDRCLLKFPFLEIMKRLSSDLSSWPKAKKQLSEAGLWQRLVFEYFCKDSTHHRDIYDRTSPAAKIAPFSLTLGMLNVWLSNGRLIEKLSAYVRGGHSSR